MKKDITCRDWKMKYCCENLWGTPGLYALVSHFANGKVPRYCYFYSFRDGTASTESQIVRTPLRVKHVSAGKPDWIFLSRFESINGRAKTFK